tara:strand:+ start:990 stop:1163 length:174 start_codon:yes stop_codon:yes gene_type:complete
MPSYKQTPLLMFPNGTIARSKTMVDGCVVIEEPELEEATNIVNVIDQTEAVKKAEKK